MVTVATAALANKKLPPTSKAAIVPVLPFFMISPFFFRECYFSSKLNA